MKKIIILCGIGDPFFVAGIAGYSDPRRGKFGKIKYSPFEIVDSLQDNNILGGHYGSLDFDSSSQRLYCLGKWKKEKLLDFEWKRSDNLLQLIFPSRRPQCYYQVGLNQGLNNNGLEFMIAAKWFIDMTWREIELVVINYLHSLLLFLNGITHRGDLFYKLGGELHFEAREGWIGLGLIGWCLIHEFIKNLLC